MSLDPVISFTFFLPNISGYNNYEREVWMEVLSPILVSITTMRERGLDGGAIEL